MELGSACSTCIIVSIVLLFVILLPLSFSYIDYYDYGLKKRKSSGKVNYDRVYASGRYMVGPDRTFLKYPADQHILHLEQLAVFSDGGNDSVGLTFYLDIDLTYAIIQDKVGDLHKEHAQNYKKVVKARTTEAIKNSAIYVSFSDYFKERSKTEAQFREAVIASWNGSPKLHVTLDQFHIGRIRIPEAVASKQLEALVQNERTAKEKFLQDARLEREETAVQVNNINLMADNLLRTAEARAKLMRTKASAQADRIRLSAINNGTKNLLKAIQLDGQNETIAYMYLRNLQKRSDLDLTVSYLSDENIVKTTN